MIMNQEPLQTFFQDNQNQFSSETIRFYKLALSQYFSLTQKNYDEVKARDIRNWMEDMTDK